MNKGLKYQIAAVIFLLLAVTFFFLSVGAWRSLQSFQAKLTFLYKGDSTAVSSKEAYLAQRENLSSEAEEYEKFAFTVWTQKDVALIESKDLGASVAVPILAVCGRTDLLFSGTEVLDCDSQGKCLLGSHTAASVFGGTDTAGLKIEYNGQEYEVAGVLPEIKDAFVYEISPKEEFLMNRITVLNDTSNRAYLKNKFTAKFSPDAEMDYELLLFSAKLFLLLIPLALGVHALHLLAGYGREAQIFGKEKIFWRVIFIVLLIVLIKMIASYLTLPADFVPSKWSDFQFWSELWNAKKESLCLWITEAVYPPDVLFLAYFGKLMLYSILSFVCYRQTAKLFRKRTEVFHDNVTFRAYWQNLRKKCRSS